MASKRTHKEVTAKAPGGGRRNSLQPNPAEITRLRQAAGLSQAALAETAGLHKRTIENLENGRRGYAANLKAIADALNVELASLIVPERGEPVLVPVVSATTAGVLDEVAPSEPLRSTHSGPWQRYRDRLLPQLRQLSLVGLPSVAVPAQNALPLLVAPAEGHERAFKADYLHLRDERRVVVSGDPGSGKSGLIRLVALDALARGKRVVRGRLKVVATKLADGVAIGEAFGASLTEDLCSPAEARALLEEAELVLLDGLDETEGARQAVIEHLASWPTDVAIVVTSRDHPDSELLSGFTHFRLLPVDVHDAKRFAQQVAARLGSVPNEAVATIWELLESHAELRTPLLIGFVLAIAFEAGSDPLPTTPARLYDRMLRLLAVASRADRPYRSNLDADMALEVISRVAWHQWRDRRADLGTLRARLEPALRGTMSTVIAFWKECAILGVSHGPLADRLEFAHESIAEYCAARHLATLGDAEITRVATAYADDPAWTQVLQFAVGLGRAQTVLEGVLASPDDRRTLLAARLAGDAPAGLGHAALAGRLVDVLAPDRPPALVAEAAEHLAALVEAGAVDAALVASRLIDHVHRTTTWDRLGVLRVRVALVAVGAKDGEVAQWILDEVEAHHDPASSFGSGPRSWWRSHLSCAHGSSRSESRRPRSAITFAPSLHR